MNESSLKALEFDRIREAVAAYAFSPLGADLVRAMAPDAASARTRQAEAAEMMAYAAAGDIPLSGLSDVRPLLRRLELDGVLTGGDLIALRDFLRAAMRAKRAFGRGDDYPALGVYAAALEPLGELADDVTRQIDDDGLVRDDATPGLSRIRRQLAAKRDEIQASLERMLNSAKVKKALREPIVTQRGGRYVLPVRTDSMSAVRGIVHAHSGSGVTAFVEPMAVVELNNQLEGLTAEEAAEVERILRALSAHAAREGDALATDVELLSELDFIAARAGYGLMYRAATPEIIDEPRLTFIKARHPLLLTSREVEKVVPIDVALGDGYVGMVISGPNNGGKTVALKTAGLLAAMALAGVPVPASSGSEVGRFTRIFADIGDESSIEGNLSTFTSHMTNIGKFLGAADERSLVLLDEVGVGTSPKYGAAIAAAVLRELRDRGTRVACTTHYDELKQFALEEEGFVNAAVDSDPVTLEPNYELKTGRPGASEALAILERLGFAADLVAAVREGLGEEEVSLAGLIARMEEREAEAAERTGELSVLRAEYEAKLAALEGERRTYDTHTAKLKQDAYDEAAKIIREARQQANVIIRELREQADVAAAEEQRRKLLEAEKAAVEGRDRLAEIVEGPAEGNVAIVEGGWITVRGTATKGRVAEVDEERGRARVLFGGVEAWVDLDDLRPAAGKPSRGKTRVEADGDVSPSLNLIGFTVEDAVLELSRYLDRALVARLGSVEIIHGHGTGRLREGVRQFLRDHPAVASYGPGPGGNEGVTVARLGDK
ncbi:MAG: endonuclease MutS2 [Candidatus Zixiibacteriota bacterium]